MFDIKNQLFLCLVHNNISFRPYSSIKLTEPKNNFFFFKNQTIHEPLKYLKFAEKYPIVNHKIHGPLKSYQNGTEGNIITLLKFS